MMITANDVKSKLIENFNVFELNLQEDESNPIAEIRKEALKNFAAMGFPTRRHEEWKYTPVSKFLKYDFEPRTFTDHVAPEKEDLADVDIPGLRANVLFFVNGHYQAARSKILEEDKFEFRDIASAINDEDSYLLSRLNSVIDREKDPFIWLNQAYMRDGAMIRIKDRAKLQYPIYLVNMELPSKGNYLDNVRHLIHVGDHCEASIISNYINRSGEDRNLGNYFIQLEIGDHSHLQFYTLQYELGNGLHIGNHEVQLGTESTFSTFFFSSDGRLVRNVSNIILRGEHSEGHMYGLYTLDGNKHCDNRTVIDHAVPNCFSNELYKGILDGNSVGVFNGKIMVRPGAQKTNAYQHNPNIILSRGATLHAKPQLEIFADDVKCTHGATSGQLDEEHLFYLRSRGLDAANAKALLTYAFAYEVVEKVKIPALREFLEKRIQGKLFIHD